jgi:tetratricopeptide (TPR) repeat protein
VQRFDRFYAEGAEVTTSSLEALRAFSLGDAEFAKGDSAASAAFVKQATELDPNFAFAYAIAGAQYGNLGQTALRDEYIKKGFALIDHAATQRERLFITAMYETRITGELTKAVQTYAVLAQTYPRDSQLHGQLANAYMSLGEFEKALPEYRESVKLSPRFTGRVAGLENACLFLGRFDEPKLPPKGQSLKTWGWRPSII